MDYWIIKAEAEDKDGLRETCRERCRASRTLCGLTRQSIVSGLHAASRIYHAATHEQIVKAACDLELKLRTGHIHMSDFDELEAA